MSGRFIRRSSLRPCPCPASLCLAEKGFSPARGVTSPSDSDRELIGAIPTPAPLCLLPLEGLLGGLAVEDRLAYGLAAWSGLPLGLGLNMSSSLYINQLTGQDESVDRMDYRGTGEIDGNVRISLTIAVFSECVQNSNLGLPFPSQARFCAESVLQFRQRCPRHVET